MSVTLADLLDAPTDAEIREQLLADLNAAGFPITDWESGAVLRTYIEMLVRGYSDLVGALLPKIAGGGFLDEAAGDWLTLLAKQLYDLDRTAATTTIQLATLTCDADNGPYTITAGQLIAETSKDQEVAGRRYRNITGGTLNTDDTLELEWESEGPNDSTKDETNYVDTADTMTKLVTPLNGVSVNNPPVDFTPVALVGTSTGTVTPSRTDSGTPPEHTSYQIKILTTGQAGVATFAYKRIGTDTSFVGSNVTAEFDIPDVGVTVDFANGAHNPSFLFGDIYSFSSPGGPIIQQGRDLEADDVLRERCRARWPALGTVATESKYVLWSKEADDQVTKVHARASTKYGGMVDVTIAGQVNPLSGAVVDTVQAYLDERADITDLPNVQAADAHDIQMSGSVVCRSGTSTAVQEAADAAWQTYIADLDLGGTVRLSELEQILMDAGAVDIQGVALTDANAPAPPSASPDVNIALETDEVATIGDNDDLPSAALTWYELPKGG